MRNFLVSGFQRVFINWKLLEILLDLVGNVDDLALVYVVYRFNYNSELTCLCGIGFTRYQVHELMRVKVLLATEMSLSY